MNYRIKANITLTAVFLFFLGMAALEYIVPGYWEIRLLLFVSEAALVGGVADWFAVTAIFKKPLGWGYHTALIPRNRERVIEAVAAIVQTELLNMNVIRRKMEEIPFVERMITSVENAGGSAYLTERSLFYLGRMIEKQDPKQLAEKLAEMIRNKVKAWNIAPKLVGISEWVEECGYVDKGLDLLAEELLAKAADERTHAAILEFLIALKKEKTENSGALLSILMGFAERSDGLNMEEAADAVQLELRRTLNSLKDPSDPLRLTLKQCVLKNSRNLETYSGFHSQIEQWKDDIITDAVFRDFLQTFVERFLQAATEPGITATPNALNHLLQSLIETYWSNLKQNAELQARINSFLATAICQMIQNEHDLIGGIVKETLGAYTNRDLNQFVEDKAGNDLQWIRINGSMIGGIVGFLLFLFLEFVYDPFISSVFTSQWHW